MGLPLHFYRFCATSPNEFKAGSKSTQTVIRMNALGSVFTGTSDTGSTFTIGEDVAIDGATELNSDNREHYIKAASYNENANQVRVNLFNKTCSTVIVAVYDSNGKMPSLSLEEIEGSDKRQEHIRSIDSIDDMEDVEIFMLNSETYQPFCESYTI